MTESHEAIELYESLIAAWNNRNAKRMADLFTEEGEMIGFDGSIAIGSSEIFSHLEPIFDQHPTPPFVHKVKGLRKLNADTVIVRAIAGMVPHEENEPDPNLNTHHTLVASNKNDTWCIELFQNTPAQFHGRPEEVTKMTDELKEIAK